MRIVRVERIASLTRKLNKRKKVKRVAEYTRKQRENMVKRANSKALEYTDQEIATLQIPKQYRFGTEMARIPVRVLEKGLKVCVSEYTLNKAN
jgi:hypothetical protein